MNAVIKSEGPASVEWQFPGHTHQADIVTGMGSGAAHASQQAGRSTYQTVESALPKGIAQPLLLIQQ